MMAGTPGFFGERLLEVREARGLTALQLGELIGVTKQAVNMYEKSRCSPSPDMFDRIVQVLHVPARYFLRPPVPEFDGPIFYRSMASATKRARRRAQRKMGWVREILRFLSDYVDLPSVGIPDIQPPADPSKLTDEMVEDAASSLRQLWGLGDGAVSNVTLLLENNGIVGSRFELESNKLDSFSLWDDYTGRPLLILGSDKQSAVRSRLDAAHELAHLLLHRNVPTPMLGHPPTLAVMEEQAYRFGRAFLLPARSFARDFTLPTLNAIKALKLKWKASIGLMIKRAQELGLVSPEQASRLWINRSQQGWNRREPFDDEMEPENPVLLARSILLLIESKTFDKDDIPNELALAAEDIESLTGLPAGYLREPPITTSSPELRLLPFPGHRAGEG